MFENVGLKIKRVSKIICWLGIIVSAISGLVIAISYDDLYWLGLLSICLGIISSWLGSLFTYGFGQLIENTSILVQNVVVAKTNDPEKMIEELKRLKDKGLISAEDLMKKAIEIRGKMID